MTWLLASVSCNILGILWDIHQQTSFPSYIDLFISDNHAISAVVHRNWSLLINTKHRTYLLHIAGWWETPATCGHTQQDSSWVYGTSWLLVILFWHEANYIVLRTSHFFSLSSSSPIPHQHIMETQPPQPAASRSKSSRLAGDTSNTSLIGTQQQRRHQLVHRDAADAATRNMTQDAHLKIVRKTASSKNKQQDAVGCKYMHILVNSRQLIVNVQQVYVESYATKFSLPVTGNLHGRPRHSAAQSAKSNIMMLSALEFPRRYFLIRIGMTGWNRLYSP